MTDAQVTLPNTPASVPTARRFVESVLLGWGLDDLAWDAAMVTSELTSNAALHAAGGSVTVRVLARVDGSARLEVSDGFSRLPQQRNHSSTSTTGRGLRIVGELSDDWGIADGLSGKTVWVELRAAGVAPSDDRSKAGGGDVDAILAAFDDAGDPPTEPPAASGLTLLLPVAA